MHIERERERMKEYMSSDDDDGYYNFDEDDEYNVDDEDGDSIEMFHGHNQVGEIRGTGPCIKVISQESLLAAQREDINRVMEFLSLKESHARTLLIHYRWDFDKVLELLVENGKDKLCADAGVTTAADHTCFQFSSVECNICFDEVSAGEVTVMDCGHVFCNDCWTQHFIVKINEGQSKRIRCMAPKCNAICDDQKIRTLVSATDPGLANKFDRFLLESYIEDNKRVKWCPSVPHCGNAIQAEDEICEVECSCGLQFCFSCSSEAHSPCSCEMWKMWSKKCKDSSETVNWFTVHTKPCPKCQKPVEKNGGCNLVCCVCGQAFCWLCGGATGREHTWTTISNHSCGRFKEDHEKKVKRAKFDLERYIHYHNRYKAHLDSLRLESNLKETIREKILKLEERESSSKDFSWIINGVNRLFKSRRILLYTYPFSYHMFGDDLFNNEITKEEREIKKNLFEDQQQQFEGNVEKLSMFLEEKFDEYKEDEILDLKMRIIAISFSTDNLCRNLYDCIENDLLGSLKWSVHKIAPYESKSVYNS